MFNVERWKEIFQSIQKNKLRDAYNDQASKEGVSRNR